MIHRHGKSFGITIWKWNKTQIELWLCLGDVDPHVHNEIDSTIVWLGGSMDGTIGGRSKRLGFSEVFHRYPIPHGTVHSAKILTFGLFANIERWSTKPTSAAIDYNPI